MSEFFIVFDMLLSTVYCPCALKKLDSLTWFGCSPSAIRTIHRNLLMSSPEYPSRPPKITEEKVKKPVFLVDRT